MNTDYSRFEYDFYLCSHVAIQGTARPVHYHVILDEANVPVNDFQRLIYNMCYQYMRSTTPVSLCKFLNSTLTVTCANGRLKFPPSTTRILRPTVLVLTRIVLHRKALPVVKSSKNEDKILVADSNFQARIPEAEVNLLSHCL